MCVGLDRKQFIRLESQIRNVNGLELSLSGLFDNPRDITLQIPNLKSDNLGLTFDEYGDFSHFTRLEYLHLNGNKYEQIPLLPASLKILGMDCNHLTKPTLPTAPNLEHLSLAHNPNVSAITCDEGNLYPNLRIINLQQCSLSQLQSCVGSSNSIEALAHSGQSDSASPYRCVLKVTNHSPDVNVERLMDSLFPAELDSWDSYELPMDISVGLIKWKVTHFKLSLLQPHLYK